MSQPNRCRKWCDHDEVQDSISEHGHGPRCVGCGCHLEPKQGFLATYLEPLDEEECDCADCKRDFWRLRPTTLTLQMPWRHEGERLRMWERNAKSWLRDFTAMWGATHHRFTPADSACASAFWNVDVVEVELSELESKANGATLKEPHSEAWRDAAISHEATAKNLQGLLADARRDLASAVCEATALRTERDALVAAVKGCLAPVPTEAPSKGCPYGCPVCDTQTAAIKGIRAAIAKAEGSRS